MFELSLSNHPRFHSHWTHFDCLQTFHCHQSFPHNFTFSHTTESLSGSWESDRGITKSSAILLISWKQSRFKNWCLDLCSIYPVHWTLGGRLAPQSQKSRQNHLFTTLEGALEIQIKMIELWQWYEHFLYAVWAVVYHHVSAKWHFSVLTNSDGICPVVIGETHGDRCRKCEY